MPQQVTFSDGSTITYNYAADGTKLRTVHTISGTTTTKDYCSNVVYENGVQKLLQTEEGYVDLSASTPAYYYYLKDHQGNNRVVINSSGTVQETNHYYPFGGVFASTGNVQPYKYNGKELDTKKGLNWYDYGARHYDATLGRWFVEDPLAEKYYAWSPYNYCINDPVKLIDPNGKTPDTVWDVFNVILGTKSFSDNVSVGNYGAAAVDGIGVVLDAVAALLPFVPGGVSSSIKAARAADDVVDVAITANKVEETTKATAKFGSKTDTYSSSRREAFRSAKEQNSIPKSQQPDNIIKPNTPEGVNRGLKDDNVKLYEFTNSKGEKVYIREDKPVKYNDGGSQPPHFNAGNKNDRKLKQHHYYGN